jgi:hypothetical protein
MIEAFRARGIYPENVASLAEESLVWADASKQIPALDPMKIKWANEIALAASAFSLDPFQYNFSDQPLIFGSRSDWGSFSSDEERELKSELASSLHEYARENAKELYLDPDKQIQVSGFHTVFRVAPNGQLLTELVVQFLQQDENQLVKLGGVPFRGGTTIVAGTDGRIRYVIAKPLPSTHIDKDASQNATLRLQRQQDYLALVDLADPKLAYGDDAYFTQRSSLRMKIASLHQGVNS